MNKIVQLIPAFHTRDAIGQHILTLHTYFKELRYASCILTLEADPEVRHHATIFHPDHLEEWKGALWLYHYALPSSLSDVFRQATGKKILIYHNLTPPHYFLPWAPHLAQLMLHGRKELASFTPIIDGVCADSRFNASELEEYGYKDIFITPILVQWENYPEPSHITRQQYFDPAYENWIFVGRVVPNKMIDALIKVFFFYRKFYNMASRLFIIGKLSNTPKYVEYLVELRTALQLAPQDVTFLGPVDYQTLATAYASADLFITLSDHEGFCLPLLEAMRYKTPILAYARGAIPETLGTGGVLVATREPEMLAELIAQSLHKWKHSKHRVEGQQKQMNKFEPTIHLTQFKEYIEEFFS